jgi:hypothetical protein
VATAVALATAHPAASRLADAGRYEGTSTARYSASEGRIRPARRRRPRARRRRGLLRLALLAVALGVVVPALYSYVTTMMRPSSLPIPIRSIEWVRDHNGAWIVNGAERLYYTWTAPATGGPTLASLPRVGAAVATAPAAPAPKTPDYQPPRIKPIMQPRLFGEGVWRPTGQTVDGGPPILVTTFRPLRDYPRVVAYVAWIDTKRAQLALYPGRYEPPVNAAGPMMVPRSQRYRLLATFNSGFKHKDGGGGFVVNGYALEPMERGKATLVVYRDGRVDVMAWGGGSRAGPDVMLARQNLPLIVSGGRPNPALDDTNAWGSTLGGAVRVWRTGVGVDTRGNLIYVGAPYQTAPSLAAALIHAGAIRAMELDINAEWPTFITYGGRGGRRATKLLPNPQQSATRYLVPDDRDFFAVYKRLPGAGSATPFR